ncbi:hypothetical protein GALL_494040 [mine drainage metagenome]|uniref:Uncharacterized protein n=1 Tax=mine drainage metagenome TaxID=410659 RepID=A0A1J5PE02_9ZZZZ
MSESAGLIPENRNRRTPAGARNVVARSAIGCAAATRSVTMSWTGRRSKRPMTRPGRISWTWRTPPGTCAQSRSDRTPRNGQGAIHQTKRNRGHSLRGGLPSDCSNCQTTTPQARAMNSKYPHSSNSPSRRRPAIRRSSRTRGRTAESVAHPTRHRPHHGVIHCAHRRPRDSCGIAGTSTQKPPNTPAWRGCA